MCGGEGGGGKTGVLVGRTKYFEQGFIGLKVFLTGGGGPKRAISRELIFLSDSYVLVGFSQNCPSVTAPESY